MEIKPDEIGSILRQRIEGLDTAGLGTQERASLEGNKRKLSLLLSPKPGQPREVTFTIRPMGAPVFVQGTRDGVRQPDLTIWFDLPPALAAQRRAQARAADRFEQQDVDYFERVRAAYLGI